LAPIDVNRTDALELVELDRPHEFGDQAAGAKMAAAEVAAIDTEARIPLSKVAGKLTESGPPTGSSDGSPDDPTASAPKKLLEVDARGAANDDTPVHNAVRPVPVDGHLAYLNIRNAQ